MKNMIMLLVILYLVIMYPISIIGQGDSDIAFNYEIGLEQDQPEAIHEVFSTRTTPSETEAPFQAYQDEIEQSEHEDNEISRQQGLLKTSETISSRQLRSEVLSETKEPRPEKQLKYRNWLEVENEYLEDENQETAQEDHSKASIHVSETQTSPKYQLQEEAEHVDNTDVEEHLEDLVIDGNYNIAQEEKEVSTDILHQVQKTRTSSNSPLEEEAAYDANFDETERPMVEHYVIGYMILNNEDLPKASQSTRNRLNVNEMAESTYLHEKTDENHENEREDLSDDPLHQISDTENLSKIQLEAESPFEPEKDEIEDFDNVVENDEVQETGASTEFSHTFPNAMKTAEHNNSVDVSVYIWMKEIPGEARLICFLLVVLISMMNIAYFVTFYNCNIRGHRFKKPEDEKLNFYRIIGRDVYQSNESKINLLHL